MSPRVTPIKRRCRKKKDLSDIIAFAIGFKFSYAYLANECQQTVYHGLPEHAVKQKEAEYLTLLQKRE
jgi:hypothetical protein